MKRFFGFALTVAVVVGLGAPAANAGCGTPLSASTADGSYYGYLLFDNDDASTVVGKFWQPGFSNSMNNGTLPQTNWIGEYLSYGFTINLADGRVTGCPDGNNLALSVFIDQCAGEQSLLLSVTQQTPPNYVDWSFTNLQLGTYYFYAGPSPRPRIISSARAGDVVNVSYNVQDASAGVYDSTGLGAITATGVYSQRVADGVQPDTDTTAGWILQTALPTAGGAGGAALDCSDDGNGATRADQWLATGITVNGEVILGCPIAVECGGNLAQPSPTGGRRLRESPGNDVKKRTRQ